MSKPGPKPKPTKIRELFGNRSRRPLPQGEPKPDPIEKPPPAPRILGQVGKKEWRRMASQLCRMRMLSDLELSGLAAYCCAYEQWVDAYEKVLKHGAVVKTNNGNIIQNPAMSIANRQQAEMRKWMTEFGFTPSSRTRVQTLGDKDKNEQAGEDFFD